MKIIKNLDRFIKAPRKPVVLALGNFDGVHLGHQAIFRSVSEKARKYGGLRSIVTFEVHPQHVLGQKTEPLFLTSFFQKLSLLEKAGIELCFLLEFSREFSEKPAETFVKEILLEQIGAKSVCLGANARFGHERRGDASLMEKLSHQFEFDFEEIDSVRIGSEQVSSTLIRGFIRSGEFVRANQMLGRPYSFYGKVVKGNGLGNRLGFPTANLEAESEVLPPQGVYAVFVNVIQNNVTQTELGFDFSQTVLTERLPAVMNYGVRPTVSKGEGVKPVIETHILHFDGDLTGKTLEVEVKEKIRDEERFPDAKALAGQIKRDILKAKEIFSTHSKSLQSK